MGIFGNNLTGSTSAIFNGTSATSQNYGNRPDDHKPTTMLRPKGSHN